jgi:hypothetical protein
MSKKIYKGDDLTRKQKLSNRVTKEEKDQDGNVKAFSDEKVYNGKHVEPPFIKLYLDDIEILYKLPKKSSQFMHELLKNMNYEGEITINSRLKERISEKLELTNVRSMNNYLTDMVNKDVIKRVARGVYMPNPYLFAKGTWENVKGLRVQYKEIDGEIKREVSPEYENNDKAEKPAENEFFPFRNKEEQDKTN